MRRIEPDRREDGQDLAEKVVANPLALRRRPVGAAREMNALGSELRQQHFVQQTILLCDERVRLHGDVGEDLLWPPPIRTGLWDVELDLLLEACNPDFEKLVQIRRDDGQESEPLEQRHGIIGGLREHAPIELENSELAIEEMRRGRCGALSSRCRPRCRGLHRRRQCTAVAFAGLGTMPQSFGAQAICHEIVMHARAAIARTRESPYSRG